MLEMLGEFMARLHEQSRRLILGPDCRPNRWDADGLFGPSSPMSSGWRLLDRPRRELFETIVEHFRDITQSLGGSPDAFGLIHADLHFGNVIFEVGRMTASQPTRRPPTTTLELNRRCPQPRQAVDRETTPARKTNL